MNHLSWAHLEARITTLREEYQKEHYFGDYYTEGAMDALDRLRDELKKEIGAS